MMLASRYATLSSAVEHPPSHVDDDPQIPKHLMINLHRVKLLDKVYTYMVSGSSEIISDFITQKKMISPKTFERGGVRGCA